MAANVFLDSFAPLFDAMYSSKERCQAAQQRRRAALGLVGLGVGFESREVESV
jgi:hypothetical protein